MNSKRVHVHIERVTLRGVSPKAVSGIDTAIRAHLAVRSEPSLSRDRSTVDRIGAAVAKAVAGKKF